MLVALAEQKSLGIIKNAEVNAEEKAKILSLSAERAYERKLKEAEAIIINRKNEEFSKMGKEAKELLKEALVKVVEISPENIDEDLLDQASEIVKARSYNL